MTASRKRTVALAGNPNSGKTTIFNNLTGSRQHVGNYPGVTVEKREGSRRFQNTDLRIVDLPGTYSLTAYSEDEMVARRFIVEERPDVVADILDASNLERNLYLAVQILELEQPTVLVLNMTDVADARGIAIQDKALAELLQAPVVRTVGNQSRGMDELLAAVTGAARSSGQMFRVDYGQDFESHIAQIGAKLEHLNQDLMFPVRWLAIKLLENDQEIVQLMKRLPQGEVITQMALEARDLLQKKNDEDPELTIADYRYRFVSKVLARVMTGQSGNTLTVSDKIDKVLTNRLYGLPIFFGLMWLLFNMVFTLGEYPKGWMEDGFKLLGVWVGQHMADGDLKSLVVDGIINGVGGVLVFLPDILLLFLGIALLEDTGYMARAAFIMDRVMRAVGLHGKSFIPLLLGFGCTVPAVMGARTLDNPRDRLVTILVAPLMSCSARLPVYTVLISAFFSESAAGTVLFSIYLLGIVLAIGMARIFRSVLFPGAADPFVMELPPYHLPTLRSVLIHMWERSILYLRKAGTIILAVSIVVWFLTSYPAEVNYSRDYQGLTAQAETAFEVQVAKEVTAPLAVEKIEDHKELEDVIAKIEAVNEAIDLETGNMAQDSPEYAAKEAEKLEKYKAVEAEYAALYPAAMRYLDLKQARDETIDDLKRHEAGEKLAQSYAGRIGHFIEPVIKPLGFDWKIGVGLFAGFTAKEVLVSTLGTIYSIGEVDESSAGLRQALAADPAFSPLTAYTLMVFVLIYAPCLATIAIIRRETNSWKWALFTLTYATVLAWVVSFVVYRLGSMFGY